MKDRASQWLVLTADQVHSRRSADGVPDALSALASTTDSLRLPFDRTVGDEIQALTDDASAVVEAVVTLSRVGEWRIGIGIGAVELPLPATTREARGPVYVAARAAVEASRRAPGRIAVRCAVPLPGQQNPAATPSSGTVTGASYREHHLGEPAHPAPASDPCGSSLLAESALVALRALLARRTEEGWQAMELLAQGLSPRDIAAHLGVSESAVSQRFTRAQRDEADRTADLAVTLLDAARRGRAVVAPPVRAPRSLVGPGSQLRAARR